MAIQKYLEELSVQQLISKYNFIIPEIQREYVWGNNEFSILDKFFLDIKEAIKESSTNEEDSIKIKAFEQVLEKADDKDKENISKLIDTYLIKKDLNIGFLYSYKPYYNYNDDTNDVFLIDGQQRLTTLFLALFYFSLKEHDNNEDFKTLFRFNYKLEKTAFDYRVRTLTHNFLIELIARCKSLEDLIIIVEKNWFLTDFNEDVTVKAMIKTIQKLHEFFKDDPIEYYQFIKKQIRFWHFKTEETSQGEELYITMNSRGQQLADNETIRAKLFENEKIKITQIIWGAKWEIWQDFFWKNKSKGGNADNGLNQFLRWANIIECFSTEEFKTRDLAEKKYKKLITENQVLDNVSLIEIEPYFNALEKLKTYFDENFFSTESFKNNFSSDWLKGDLGQIHLIKLFPALMYIMANKPKEHLNRFIRFFSNITNDIDIAKNPDNYIIESIQLTKLFLEDDLTDVSDLVLFKDQFTRILSSEEVFKLSIYKKESDIKKRQEIEEAFWHAEDFQYSKGKIGHLLQMSVYRNNTNLFTYNRNFQYSAINDIDLADFKKLFSTYSEIINKENEIWGDLIDTDVYFEASDRVYITSNWHLNNGFLRVVLKKNESHSASLKDFLIRMEKDFIASYETEDDLVKETNYKKQLYIYYILHKRILKKWSWIKWNFGIYAGHIYPNTFSIFNNKRIYQFYNSQWRYNVGYERETGIWIQDNYSPQINYIRDLIYWAKG